MDVIERLRQEIQQRGWTEYRLAKESGLAQSTISNIFRRGTLPSIPTLDIICRAMGLTLSQFFKEAPSEKEEFLLQKWSKLNERQRDLISELLDELQ